MKNYMTYKGILKDFEISEFVSLLDPTTRVAFLQLDIKAAHKCLHFNLMSVYIPCYPTSYRKIFWATVLLGVNYAISMSIGISI